MNKLNVRLNDRTDKKTGESYSEATVQLVGLKPTKLVKNDGCTRYTSRSQATQAAQRLATRLGCTIQIENESNVRCAAKKSVKKNSPAKECCGGDSCNPTK